MQLAKFKGLQLDLVNMKDNANNPRIKYINEKEKKKGIEQSIIILMLQIQLKNLTYKANNQILQ